MESDTGRDQETGRGLVKPEKIIPYNFALDYLQSLHPDVKSMFGMYSVYIGDKIMLMLRRKKGRDKNNGVWVACQDGAFDSLHREFPALRALFDLKRSMSDSHWKFVPEAADDFEESVIGICNLIARRDPRVGRIPQRKSRKK